MHKLLLFGLLLLIVSCARPVAEFTIEAEEEKKAPVEIQFTNESEQAESFFWDFGDGTYSTDTNPVHRFTRSGNYVVQLRAMKGNREAKKEMRLQVLPPENCLIEIETTFGTMLAELFDETPIHRDNFTKLAKEGFYDSLLFHRVIKGFMIQGGDPDSRNVEPDARLGAGGPGYQIDAEINPRFVHTKGAIAAARTGDAVNPEKKSSGSQFYIVHGNTVTEDMLRRQEMRSGFNYSPEQVEEYEKLGGAPFLDGEYTVFGRVISGLEVIDKIAEQPTNPGDRPREDIIMSIKVIQ
ncbi:MAG: PKD domain-containing protein [Saprospirales bacterium]|nr:MAG: PKD domain-containing protein [Saprospirales bacterium]